MLLAQAPATQDYTPAEDLAIALNKGRPAVEGIEGGTSTDALPDEDSAPFITGRSILLWSIGICTYNSINHA